ncbi:autotransporter outer membrane beta-barrel domain-containing protein [Stenotrophomonas sp. TEPEL]|uniref:autotransporter outer membrane beta-barrel domain-containing protein n=1 Tax=Stenotrophomonas sp. TEPEL TaxID=2283801 RepID=UPI0010497D2E|nr:autotransporter outer membrane beta-barrel domain-containing protein [Stenotrophomonas sp. TEPEL]TDB35077.1 autotransporter outer membrane beta-barrel domain-containing protein [Stenotrophomonas sp. TEPEL]
MQTLRLRPHLLALAVASVAAAPIALAQQVVANGTQETPPAGTYQTTAGHAFHALNGGSITPLGPVTLATTGDGDAGARAEGPGSQITLDGADITTAGANAAGLSVDGYQMVANNARVETTGTGSHGAQVENGLMTLASSDILARGNGAHGLFAVGVSEIYFSDGQVAVEGANANAIRSTGSGGFASLVYVERATLISRAAGTTVVLADQGGIVNLSDTRVVHETPGLGVGLGVVAQVGSQVAMVNVDIEMQNDNAMGLSGGGLLRMRGGSITALGAGSRAADLTAGQTTLTDVRMEADSGIILRENARLTLTGGSVTSEQVALDVNGMSNTATVEGTRFLSHQQAAVRVYHESTLSMQDSTVSTEADSAVGMDLRAGTTTLDNVQIDTQGASSHGLYADVRISGFRPSVTASAMSITTDGDGAAGVMVRGGAGVDIAGSQVLTRGAQATGVVSRGSGRLTLADTDVRTEGADAWAALIEDNGRLTINGGSLVSAQGGGLWLRSSRDSELVLANGAQLTGGNGTALALDAAVAGRFDVRLEDGAQMNGDVVIHPDDVAAGLVPQSEVHVALDAASLWSGGTVLAQNVSLAGGSQWTLQGTSEVGALTLDDSTLVLGSDARGGVGTLTVTGDLTTTGARLMFRGALADDASELGHLHVLGDTGGDASISVENLGGRGAQTVDGIELIQVDGASLGAYTLSGRAVAGLYEYLLHKGGVAGGEGNWYLRSAAYDPCEADPDGPGCTPVIPDPCEVDPTGPGCTPVIPDPCDVDPEAAGCTPVIPEPILRPEPGAYLANQVAAVNMFQHRLHDRVGEPSFAKGRGAWARVSQQQPQFTTLGQQLSVRGSSAVVQIGSDLFQREGLALGVMLGSGRSSSAVTSDLTAYSARGRVRGAAAGVYGTWLQDPSQGLGLYVDASVQYARFDNRVQGDGLARESYDSRAGIGSLEGGYTINVWQGVSANLYLQPQLQLSYVDYRANRHVESNGTVVDNDDAGGLSGRVGLRVFGRGTGEGNVVQPFLGVNWLRGSRTSSLDFDGDTLAAEVPRNRYEVQAGAELKLGIRWGAWAGVTVQRGEQDYRNVGGQLGVRMAW